MINVNDRCPICGAKHETHDQDHLCRMHRATPFAPCDICGAEADSRALVCMFCGEGFGYSGETPDESTLKAAIEHEKECPKNPYKAEIERLKVAEGLVDMLREENEAFAGDLANGHDLLSTFDGHFVAWNEIISACGGGCYSQSPLELISGLIDERDELRTLIKEADELLDTTDIINILHGSFHQKLKGAVNGN